MCAKALAVDHLIAVAASDFMSTLSAMFVLPMALTALADLLEKVFESTKNGSDVLREKVTAMCLEKHRQCSSNRAVAAILEEHESSLWKIAFPFVQKMEAKRDTDAALAQDKGSIFSTGNQFGTGRPFTFDPVLASRTQGLFGASSQTSVSQSGILSGGPTQDPVAPSGGLFGGGSRSSGQAPKNLSGGPTRDPVVPSGGFSGGQSQSAGQVPRSLFGGPSQNPHGQPVSSHSNKSAGGLFGRVPSGTSGDSFKQPSTAPTAACSFGSGGPAKASPATDPNANKPVSATVPKSTTPLFGQAPPCSTSTTPKKL